MVASARENVISLWDVAIWKRLLIFETFGRLWITGLTFSPDGKMVASMFEDAVNLWDVEVVDAKAEDEDGKNRLLQSLLSKSDLLSETEMPLTIPMAPASTPYLPGEEEQTFYCFGLPFVYVLVLRHQLNSSPWR